MYNYNKSEVFSKMESPLLEQAKTMDKITDPKELDKPITNYVSATESKDYSDDESITELADDDEADDVTALSEKVREGGISGCPIEGHGGHWKGNRGDSKWVPDRDAKPNRYNPNGRTWGQILDKHGIDGINYSDGDPNFGPISKGTVKIRDFSSDRPTNFAQADEALAKKRGCKPEEVKQWRERNGYTWHECRDCSTMQKVPREVHNNMDHSGGISEYKNSH